MSSSVRKAGINIPIVPGILPVQNFKQSASFAIKCGTDVPAWLAKRFEGLEDDPETRRMIAALWPCGTGVRLLDNGVTDFHFYTMNKADLVFAICHMLGLRARRWQRLPDFHKGCCPMNFHCQGFRNTAPRLRRLPASVSS